MNLLNIHYHPNNDVPVRFRLQIKEMDVQEYFSFKQFGSEDEALKAAMTRRDALLKIHNLRKNMGFRQIFKDDGFIRGITFTTTMRRRSIYLGLHVSTDGKRAKRIKERTVNAENLDTLFYEFLDDLLVLKNITLDAADKALIKKIRMNYIREYHRLKDRLDEINRKNPIPKAIKGIEKPSSIFSEDNRISGLKLNTLKHRQVIILRVWARKDGKVKRVTDRQVNAKNFNATFKILVELIADMHKFKLTDQDHLQIKKIQQKYKREYNRLLKALPDQ